MLLALVVGLKKCPFLKITTDEVLYIPTHTYCTLKKLWRNQGQLVQNYYLGSPSKRKREASSGCGEQTTHWCSSAIEITLGACSRQRPSKGTAETSFSISSKNIASQCLWQPSRVVYKEEDSDQTRNNFFPGTESTQDHWRWHPRNREHPLRFRAESILRYDIMCNGTIDAPIVDYVCLPIT